MRLLAAETAYSALKGTVRSSPGQAERVFRGLGDLNGVVEDLNGLLAEAEKECDITETAPDCDRAERLKGAVEQLGGLGPGAVGGVGAEGGEKLAKDAGEGLPISTHTHTHTHCGDLSLSTFVRVWTQARA